MTLGQLRSRLSKFAPGIDLELLSGWIQDRYQAILDRLSWTRVETEGILVTPASYATGTVAVTNGSTGVTGTGTTFTAAMTGALIRIASEEQWYRFTYTGATTGTLDRAYQGTTGIEYSYRIDKAVYALPSTFRGFRGEVMQLLSPSQEIRIVSRSELAHQAACNNYYGDPFLAALVMDTTSDPPLQQVAFFPIPETVLSIAYWYTADPAAPSGTSASLLPWVRTSALEHGVKAEISAHEKDWESAAAFEALAEKDITQMIGVEAQRKPAQTMRAADWITRHNRRRWLR